MSWVPTSWWEWQAPKASDQRKRKPGCFAWVAIVLVIFVVGSCIWVAIENATKGQRAYDAVLLIDQELDALTPPPTNTSREYRGRGHTVLFGPTDNADEFDTTLPCQQVQDYYRVTAPDNGWRPADPSSPETSTANTYYKQSGSYALTMNIVCYEPATESEPGRFEVYIETN